MNRYTCFQTWHPFQFILFTLLLLLALPFTVTAGQIVGTVIDSEGKPIKDAVVFILNIQGVEFQPLSTPVPMDQINYTFVPHVLPVLVGTTVTFPNKDNIYHHVYSFSKAKKFERPLYKGSNVKPVVFDKVGIARLGCNIHDTMSAVILVLQNPYFGITDEHGKYVISESTSKEKNLNVPAGKHKLVAWHEFMSEKLVDTLREAEVTASGHTTADYSLKINRPKPKKEKPGSYNQR